jgi:hypothetical protein
MSERMSFVAMKRSSILMEQMVTNITGTIYAKKSDLFQEDTKVDHQLLFGQVLVLTGSVISPVYQVKLMRPSTKIHYYYFTIYHLGML